MPGTSSPISPGASCRSACAIGPMGPDQRVLVLTLSQNCNAPVANERARVPPMREERDMSNAADDFSLLVGPDVPTRNYAAGAIIFREGDRGNEFFVIKRGTVHI